MWEGGARRGVLRQAARNRSPREARDPALQALRPGCEELAVTEQCPPSQKLWRACSRPAEVSAKAGDGERSAAPEPKIAAVERREASVPRHGKFVHGALYNSIRPM